MNRIYRTLWSVATQSWQAVPETAKSASKKSKSSAGGVLASVALGLILVSGANAQAPPAANQLPTGGSVARGTATISQTATAQAAAMTVNQSSQHAVINWNTFNVGSNASVNFVQPNAQAVTLNRVNDSNPSQIFGRITANGQVFLTNANGVYFSPSSSVDVGALTATTHSITDDNFMSGKYVFDRNGATGKVVNEGNITAALGGYVALLAPEVQNAGVVVARAGMVALAAGEAITLSIDGSGSLAGITTTPSAIASLVENKLAVLAPDGQIILSAVALDKLQAGVVRNSGTLDASSLVNKGGKIVLEGDEIVMDRNSKIEAKGRTGGGVVLVGGDWQGSGTLRQATKVTMEAGATIDASATDNGDGGKVVLWSDVHNANSVTQVNGSIKAEAGPSGGDGGQVETSGHVLNVDNIQVSTQANAGKAGEWLLDPYSISIDASAAGTTWAAGTAATAGTYTSAATSTILASDITTALLSNNVTIQTGGTTTPTNDGFGNGDINVNTNISWAANKLTLKAHGNINVNAVMTSTAIGAALELFYGQGTDTGSGSFLTMKMGTNDDWVGKINLVAGTTNFATTQGRLGTRKTYTVITELGASNTSVTKTDLQGINGDLTLNYAIGADINAIATDGWTNKFSPLTSVTGFTGTFDGLGHIISRLTVKGASGVGLFGKTGSGAVIQNIGLIDETVTSGSMWGGGLVGYVSGSMSLRNSFNTGRVDSTITTSSSIYTGGLIGYMAGANASSLILVTVSNSYSKANVNSNAGRMTGGLLGGNQYTAIGSGISYSYSSGNVTSLASDVGGLIGTLGAKGNFSIYDSYATGAVSGTTNVGGLIGNVANTGTTTATVVSINRTYVSGQVSGSAAASTGGEIGTISSAAVSSLSGSYNYWDVHSTTVGNAVGSGSVLTGLSLVMNKLNNGTTGEQLVKTNFGTFNFSGSPAVWGMSSTGPYLCGIGATCQPPTIYLLPVASQSSTYGASPTTLQYCYSSSASSCVLVTGDANIPATVQTFNLVSGGVPQTTATINIGSSSGTLTLSGAPVGGFLATNPAGASYSLTLTPPSTLSGYTFSAGNAVSYTINKAPLTVTATSVTKTYDGVAYTGGAGVTYSGFVNSENNSALGGALTYSGTSQSAVNASTTPYVITPSGLTSGNYTITFADGSLTINKAPLTVTATSVTKTYDGVAYSGGGGVTYSGFVNNENNSVLGGALAYSGTSQSAVNASTTPYVITPSGLTSGNYTITFEDGSLTINKAPLTVTATSVTKTYDGVAYSGGGGVTYSGFVNSENNSALGGALTYSGTSQSAVNASTTPYVITPSGLTSGNYTITFADGSLTINKAILTVTGVTVSKTYDGTNVAAFTGGALSGVVAADANNASKLALVQAGTFAQTGVGSGIAVTTTDSLTGTSAGNYTLTQPTLTGAITTKALTVTGTTVANKTYDGTNAATLSGGTLQGVISGDTVTLTQAGTFSQAGVGTGLTVTINDSISGNSNYTLTQPASLTADITPKALGLSIPGATRMYNGTTSISVGTVALIGVVGTDAVSLTGGGTVTGYVDKNVGTNKTVIYTSLSLTGAAALNYTLPVNPTSNANITAAPLSIAGITVADKTYDGGNTATVSTSSVVATGLITGDAVTVAATGSFADKNAGSGKTVNLTSSYSGADAGNYSITDQATATASIAKAPLTVTADNITRTIGATTPALSTTLSGFVGGETLATSGVTGSGLATTTATPTTEGAYVITAGVGTLAASNYSFPNLVNGTLTVRSISALNNSEVTTLIGSQLANLTGPQMASFSTTQLTVFSQQQIALLSPSQFAGFTPEQLASLNTAQLQGLTTAQLSSMSLTQLGGLTASQLAVLSTAQLQGLTAAQVRALSVTQISQLTPEQIAFLTGTPTTPLSLQQMMALSPAQIGAMSTVQVARLTAAELGSLSDAQLIALSLDQLASLSPASFSALSSEQIMALSLAQVASLTPDQLRGLSPTQIASLSAAEIATFDELQLAAIGMLPSADATDASQEVVAKYEAPIPVMTEVATPNAPVAEVAAEPAPAVASATVVQPSVSTVEITPVTTPADTQAHVGVLPVTVFSSPNAQPTTTGVAFEQDDNGVSLRITAAPPVPPMADKLTFNDKLTSFMVASASGQMVEFQGGLINKRLVIVAPSAAAKQIARSEMIMVLAAAITSLGLENRVVLADLSGVVINLR